MIMEIHSFDPNLFWPSTVVDLIFQHLTGNEVLQATRVSPSWEHYIAKSKVCMSKIVLKIIGRQQFLTGREHEIIEALKMIAKRGRNYENFTLYAHLPGFLTRSSNKDSALMNVLNSRSSKWKNITIWYEKFEEFSELEELLNLVALNVECLDLKNLSFKKSSFLKLPLESKLVFKKLKRLSLGNVENIDSFFKKIGSCYLLESLELENGSKTLLNDFPTAFLNSNYLRKLTLFENHFTREIFTDLSRLDTLKLTDFKIKSHESQSNESQSELAVFLQLQSPTLANLTIDMYMTNATERLVQTIFRLNNLKTLHLTSGLPDDMQYPVNNSVVELYLNSKCDSQKFSSIAAATPNLKILKLQRDKLVSLDEGKIRETLPKLETLELF